MRTRERLVEVLGTIGEAAGPAPYLMFNMAAMAVAVVGYILVPSFHL